ncbi:hypothetical protein ACVMVB_19315, partial [Stenotrophomonas maltophilia]
MVDVLLMEDYQNPTGAAAGWGRLHDDAQWQALARVRNGYQDILFGTPEVARDVAAPLLAHVAAVFADVQAPKVSLLVGHDSNIGSVLAALGVSAYTLPGQREKTPIGGLLQFERWRAESGEARYRLAYVYPTRDQLRDALPLDEARPPGRVEQAAVRRSSSNASLPWPYPRAEARLPPAPQRFNALPSRTMPLLAISVRSPPIRGSRYGPCACAASNRPPSAERNR